MLGFNGISLPLSFGNLPLFFGKNGFKTDGIHSGLLVDFSSTFFMVCFGLLIVWFGPSSVSLFYKLKI